VRASVVLVLVAAVGVVACATPRGPSPVLPDDSQAPRADLYVFNVSRGSLIPLRRYVTIDGHPLVRLWRETWRKTVITPGVHDVALDDQRVRLDAVDGGAYYVAVGYHPRRAWLLPVGAHPIFIRRLSEADALRLFTEMKPAR
jgi:hypothetical protein